jgi:hypothetical protein
MEHLFQKFFTALCLFQKLEQGWSEEGGTRALRVPLTFVVPSQEGNGGPREFWGYRLGESVPRFIRNNCTFRAIVGLELGAALKDIRLKGAYLSGSSGRTRRALLDALGFNWTPKRGRRKKTPLTSDRNS